MSRQVITSTHTFLCDEWNLLLLNIFQSFVCCANIKPRHDDFITFFQLVKVELHVQNRKKTKSALF